MDVANASCKLVAVSLELIQQYLVENDVHDEKLIKAKEALEMALEKLTLCK